MDHGATHDAVDRTGRTALLQAIQSHQPHVIEVLLARRNVDFSAAVAVRNGDALALHFAASVGARRCVELLLKDHKTKHFVDATDCFSDSPFDLARRSTSNASKEIVDLLTMSGAVRRSSVSEDHLGLTVRRGSEITAAYVNKCPSRDVNGCPIASGILPHRPVFKTYSPIKMALARLLTDTSRMSSSATQEIVIPVGSEFYSWLDQEPCAFQIDVSDDDISKWMNEQTRSPSSLKELCRGLVRQTLGYRADDKVDRLQLPASVRDYFNMEKLDEIKNYSDRRRQFSG